MFEREVVTEEFLIVKGAVEFNGNFYLNGYSQAHETTFCFFRDQLAPNSIGGWCFVDRDARPAVWLPTDRVEDFGNQRVLVSRFWSIVLILGIVFKS